MDRKKRDKYREWYGAKRYSGWVTFEQATLTLKKPGNNPKKILAEGDSWYNYSVCGDDVIDHLEKFLEDTKINNNGGCGL